MSSQHILKQMEQNYQDKISTLLGAKNIAT
jgi:hypothetical protein